VDPFTYAVHGFKSLLLKETGLAAIVPDMIYLTIFAVVTLALAVPLFKRTL
jgi:ABC-2 type transport system permease protein